VELTGFEETPFGSGYLGGHCRTCSIPSALNYFFSVLATYTRSGHWQKYPFANLKANLHRLGYTSRHSRYLSSPKSFALQRFLNPASAHVKFFGHFMSPMISLIFFLCSSFMIPSLQLRTLHFMLTLHFSRRPSLSAVLTDSHAS